jgi:hypothetical protein
MTQSIWQFSAYDDKQYFKDETDSSAERFVTILIEGKIFDKYLKDKYEVEASVVEIINSCEDNEFYAYIIDNNYGTFMYLESNLRKYFSEVTGEDLE